MRGLQQALRTARSELSSYAGDVYKASLGADPSDVESGVRQAASRAESFARESYKTLLGADSSEVHRDVATAERLGESFARQTYEATLGIRGAAKTAGELKVVDKVADSVDGRNVNVDVDSDGRGVRGLSALTQGFSHLASGIKATKTVLLAASIPFTIAAVGGAVPAVVAASASLAGLALNLGKAATGFGLVAGAAGGGALAGLSAYGAGISFVVGQAAQLQTNLLAARSAMDSANAGVQSAKEAVKAAKPGTVEYVLAQQQLTTALQQQAQAAREYRRQQILNTPAAQEFASELQESARRLTQLQAAVGRRVFPRFTSELDAWNEIISELTPSIARTAGNVGDIAAGFSEWFRTADDGKVLRDIVGFINTSATKGAASIAALGQTGIMAFRPLIPLASQFQSNLLGVVRNIDRWVSSTEGQRRLGGIYRSLWSDANRLWDILKDVDTAVFNVFDAVDKSGIADQATNGLSILANGLARITAKGSEGRKKLNEFLGDAKRLMPFVGDAALELASAFGRVVSKVIDFREKGHRLTTLQEIFRGISRTAGPMADLLIGTFEDLGPQIAKLIPRMVEFLGTFAGSSGPLVTFTKTLNQALKIFNNLPDPIKHTAANAAALYLILKPFGGGAIVGALANIVQQYITWRIVAGRLNKVLGNQPPVAPTVPATGPSAKRLWATRLASLAAGLALITIAVTFDYKGAQTKTKQAMKKAREDGKLTADEFGDALADGLVKGLQGVPILGSVVTFLDNNIFKPGEKALDKWNPLDYWVRRLDPKQRVPKLGFIGRTLMEAVITGMKGIPIFGPLLQQLDILSIRGGKKAKEARKIGETVSSRIVDGLKNVPIIGPFVRILDALFGRSKRKVGQQRWKPIGAGAAAQVLAGFLGGGLIGGAVGLIVRWFTRSKAKRNQQRWQPLGKSAIADILKGFLGGGLIGGAVKLIDRWFGRSKRKSEGQRWKPLGAGAAADLLKGFLSGGLIGGTLALIERWFTRSKRKRESQRWKPLGDTAAAEILKGFATGGLIGGAVKLIVSWFSKSKRKGDDQRWKPIGIGAAGKILAGFLGGGLIVGAVNLVQSWFSRSKQKAEQHRWKPIGDGAVGEILDGFLTGGLIGGTLSLIDHWFGRAKEKRQSQDWKGIGLGAAFQAVTGFVSGGIVGTVGDVLSRAADKGKDQKPKFEKSGKDSARGFCHGFGIVDLGKCLVDHVKGAWEKVRKWGGEGSPWRRTMLSGIEAAKGFALGLLRDGGLAERNAKKLAGRVAKAIRDGVVDLGDVPRAVWDQLLKRGWVGDPADSRERLSAPDTRGGRNLSAEQRAMERERLEARNAYRLRAITYQGRTPVREWDMGSPRDMVSTILNSQADSIGKSWARYLVYHLNRLPDSFRSRRAGDIQRLAPRLRSLGFSGFEDGTFVSNARARQFRRGRPTGKASLPNARQDGRNAIVRAEDGSLVPRGFYRNQQKVQEEIRDGIVNLGDVQKKTWDKLLRKGWQGDPRDHAERLYSPARLRRRGMIQAEDRSWVPPSFYGNTTRQAATDSSEARLSRLFDEMIRVGQAGNKTAVERVRAEIELTQRQQQQERRTLRTQGQSQHRAEPALIAPAHRTEPRPAPTSGASAGGASAGGHPITASEFRRVLREHTRDLARLMRAGMADAPNLSAFQRQMDKSLGGYLGFRNGMGAQPQ